MLPPASLARASPVGVSQNLSVKRSGGTATPHAGSPHGDRSNASQTAVASPTHLTAAPGLSIAVNGNHFVNGRGKTVTLHGVNISGTEWQCIYGQAFYGPSGGASIAAIAAWHVNAVRIPLNEDCWLGINGAPTDIASYHRAIRNYVDRLHAHDLYAILDLHWSAPGTTLSHLGSDFAGFFEMADADHSPEFWSSVASYFKDDHAVLFDLFNEPNGISWKCWRNGCRAPRGFQTAGMQQLVNAVRGTGSTSPVMVGGLNYAGQLGQQWLQYHPNDSANQLVASEHNYGQTDYSTNIGLVAAKFPVVVGELGEANCAHNYLDSFLPWADSHGVSYLAWAWFVGNCARYPALISNYDGTPTHFGIGYREHLAVTFPAPDSAAAGGQKKRRRSLRHTRSGRIRRVERRQSHLLPIRGSHLRARTGHNPGRGS